jgi:hypothetical protein
VASCPIIFEKYIVKSVGAFEQTSFDFFRRKDIVTLEEEQNLTMHDQSRGLRYPSGVRPFKSLEERGDLDEPWSESVQAELAFNVRVPMGSSRREAIQLVHHAASLFSQKKKLILKAAKNIWSHFGVLSPDVHSSNHAQRRLRILLLPWTWMNLSVNVLALMILLLNALKQHMLKLLIKFGIVSLNRLSNGWKRNPINANLKANLLKHKPECLLVDFIDQRVSVNVSEAYGDDLAVEGGVPVVDQVAAFVLSIQKWRIPRCGPGAQQTFQK